MTDKIIIFQDFFYFCYSHKDVAGLKIMSIKKIILTVFIILLFSVFSEAQMRYQLHKSRNETSWFAGFNLGMTSYYGSLAVFNRDPLLKLQKESKFAFGFVLGKSFNKFVGARAYYTLGGLKAQNNDLQVIYDAKLNSFGGQIIVQFTTLIGRMDYVPDYALYGIIGAGMLRTKPEILTIPTEDDPESIPIDSLNYSSQVSSLDFNIGLGGSYEIFDQVDINAEISYFLSFSEELDLTSGGGNDNFLHLSLGAIYRFGFRGHRNTSAFGRKRR